MDGSTGWWWSSRPRFRSDSPPRSGARRGALRLSQRDLADLAGVSERFVRFVEQGKRSVQLDSLLALLDTLGLELRLDTRASAAAHGARTASRAAGEPPADRTTDAGPEARP